MTHPTYVRHPLTGGVCLTVWGGGDVATCATEHHEPRHATPFRALLGTSPIPYVGKHRRRGALELKPRALAERLEAIRETTRPIPRDDAGNRIATGADWDPR